MRENQPSAVVYELLADLGACVGLDATLALLDSGLRRLLPFDAMVVFLPRQDGFFPAYTSPSAHSRHSRKNGAAALAGSVAETRRPAFHSNPALEPGREPYRSVLAVPLDDGPELAAVLALYALEHGVFQPQDLGVLLWMRADLARAIRHAVRHPQEDTAYDPITGLRNERGFFARLDAELAGRGREHSLALLLAGVGGLAEARGRFGDYAPGALLSSIGAGLRRACVEPAWAARLGDDFAVLEPALKPGLIEARRAAVSALIAGIGAAHCGEPLLSVRLGAAYFPQDGSNPEGLLAAATARQASDSTVGAALSKDLLRLSQALHAKAEQVA